MRGQKIHPMAPKWFWPAVLLGLAWNIFGISQFLSKVQQTVGSLMDTGVTPPHAYNMIYGTKKLNEDISVPRSKLPIALDGIYKIGEKYGFQVPCFGHAGDGNIHVNVMVKDKTNEKEMEDGHKAIEEIFQYVVDLGGTLSGEHGIGTSKAPFMHIAFTEAEMNLFRSIKKAFDPNNILNPFKMGL